jgi:hypothetical protein
MTEEITSSEEAAISSEIFGSLKQGVWFTLFFGTTPRAFIIDLRGTIDGQSRVDVEVNDQVVALLDQNTPSTTAEGLKIRLRSQRAAPQSFAARPF